MGFVGYLGSYFALLVDSGWILFGSAESFSKVTFAVDGAFRKKIKYTL